MGTECWICRGRSSARIVLRPDGEADGRRVCRGCVRRLIGWLGGPGDDREAALGQVWMMPTDDEADDTPPARRAFLEAVAASLPAADAPTRWSLAVVLLTLGFDSRALEALGGVDPEYADVATERRIASLLSRLLSPGALAPGARDALESALYPGAAHP